MPAVKYSQIKKLDLDTIKNNNLLSMTISKKEIERCANTIREYGLLTPLVVRQDKDNFVLVLGQCELNALKKIGVFTVEAFIIDCQDNTEANKLSLLLSTLRTSPNPLSEGLILKELLKTGTYSQSDIAYIMGKSVSWVSKRLSLVERLKKSVLELVATNKLACHTAQEIARLPQEVQDRFASNVIIHSIPKSSVEKLVSAYNKSYTDESLKNKIINNPNDAITYIKKAKELQAKKENICDEKNEEHSNNDKLYSSLKWLLKLTQEIELIITDMDSSLGIPLLSKISNSALRLHLLIEENIQERK